MAIVTKTFKIGLSDSDKNSLVQKGTSEYIKSASTNASGDLVLTYGDNTTFSYSSTTSYVAGTGIDITNNIISVKTTDLKLSDFTDDILSGHYLPLTGGNITGAIGFYNGSTQYGAFEYMTNSQFDGAGQVALNDRSGNPKAYLFVDREGGNLELIGRDDKNKNLKNGIQMDCYNSDGNEREARCYMYDYNGTGGAFRYINDWVLKDTVLSTAYNFKIRTANCGLLNPNDKLIVGYGSSDGNVLGNSSEKTSIYGSGSYPTYNGTQMLLNGSLKTINGHDIVGSGNIAITAISGATVTISESDITNMFESFIRGYYTMSNGVKIDVFLQKGIYDEQEEDDTSGNTLILKEFVFSVPKVFTSTSDFVVTATASSGTVQSVSASSLASGRLTVWVNVRNQLQVNPITITVQIANTTRAFAFYFDNSGKKVSLPYGTTITAYTVS